MDLPALRDLWPFSNLPQKQFALLYHVHVRSKGTVDAVVRFHIDEPLMRDTDTEVAKLTEFGYLTYGEHEPSHLTLSMTNRGHDEIIFCIYKSRRHQILRCVHRLGEADPSALVSGTRVGEELKLDPKRLLADFRYLQEHGLLRLQVLLDGGKSSAALTAKGIAVVEGAADEISRITQIVLGDVRHNSDNNITSGANSPIQDRTTDSTQDVGGTSPSGPGAT